MKALKLWLAVLCLVSLSASAEAGVRRYRLFGGADTDSTEQASAWVPVRGAFRAVAKVWSTHAAFTGSGAGDPDSVFADSITTFKLAFSDTVCCQQNFFGQLLNVGADSVLVDMATLVDHVYQDTTFIGVAARPLPINKALRSAANGGGLIIDIRPGIVGTGTVSDPSAVFTKDYMRIRVTPLRRKTSSFLGTNRVNGLKGFIGYIDIYRDEGMLPN